MSRSGTRLRERYTKAGLVQINAWVPKDKAYEILEDCTRLRREHLRHNEYWRMLERDENGNQVYPGWPPAD